MDRLRAGAAVTNITPPLGSPLAGLFHQRPAASVEGELTAKALVLDDGRRQVALVVCDVIALAAATVRLARARIAAATGIEPEGVMIAGTHTHSGPITTGARDDPADEGYLDFLVARIVDAVVLARRGLRPARITLGSAAVEGICFNRRFRMKDGTVVFNPGVGNPEIVETVGPVDPTVTALLAEAADGTPIALWANLALHYVGVDDERAISPDYFGAFAGGVQRLLGEGCVGLLANGASGNINNVDVAAKARTSPSRRAERVGTTVAAAAIGATLGRRPLETPSLDAWTPSVELTRRAVTPEDLELADRVLAQLDAGPIGPVGGFSFVRGQPIPPAFAPAFARDVSALAAMPARAAVELQLVRIGDLSLLAIPGEIFVEFGLSFRSRAPTSMATIVGLANGCVGYLPTLEAYEQGGYETWAHRVSWTAPGSGEAMVEAALRSFADRMPVPAPLRAPPP